MSHDKLCPGAKGCKCCGTCMCEERVFCWCDLIADVREDSAKKAEGAYIVGTDGKVLDPSHPEYTHDGTSTWNSAVSAAIAYMKGEVE